MIYSVQRAREAAAAISPEDLFRNQKDKFSQYDGQGIPTHDAQGQLITENQKKKMRKQWQIQEKKYKEYLLRK